LKRKERPNRGGLGDKTQKKKEKSKKKNPPWPKRMKKSHQKTSCAVGGGGNRSGVVFVPKDKQTGTGTGKAAEKGEKKCGRTRYLKKKGRKKNGTETIAKHELGGGR